MNNRPGAVATDQTPFALLTTPSFSRDELLDLSDAYSERVVIPNSIANSIIDLLADMERFYFATGVDDESPEDRAGTQRKNDYINFLGEGGIAKMHKDALGSMNGMAASLNRTIGLQKETTPESVDLSDAVKYCKDFICYRLDVLKKKKDLYFKVYKNTNTHENKLKALLESDSAPMPRP